MAIFGFAAVVAYVYTATAARNVECVAVIKAMEPFGSQGSMFLGNLESLGGRLIRLNILRLCQLGLTENADIASLLAEFKQALN